MKRILDKSFRYIPSHQTNVKKTFERIRREIREQQRRVVVLPRTSKQGAT